MDMTTVLAFGLVLGLRHAIDADHLVAVTSMLSDGKRFGAALAVGAWWGLGHAVALVGIGALVLATGWSVPLRWQGALEALVGVTIVALGAAVLWQQRRRGVHWHEHSHADTRHAHFHRHQEAARRGEHHHELSHPHDHSGPGRIKAMAVGAVHGFAGTGPLVVLLALTFPSLPQRYAALLASALGAMAGMTVVTAALALPFARGRTANGPWFARLQISVGVAGVLYGAGFIVRAVGML